MARLHQLQSEFEERAKRPASRQGQILAESPAQEELETFQRVTYPMIKSRMKYHFIDKILSNCPSQSSVLRFHNET